MKWHFSTSLNNKLFTNQNGRTLLLRFCWFSSRDWSEDALEHLLLVEFNESSLAISKDLKESFLSGEISLAVSLLNELVYTSCKAEDCTTLSLPKNKRNLLQLTFKI